MWKRLRSIINKLNKASFSVLSDFTFFSYSVNSGLLGFFISDNIFYAALYSRFFSFFYNRVFSTSMKY